MNGHPNDSDLQAAAPRKSSHHMDDPPPYRTKLKYPVSVFFIIANEFCERFSYYGMRTILALYLAQELNYSENTATIIYHGFVILCYWTPLFGGIIADSWLGKYRTILYISLIYALGNIVLSTSSISSLQIPHSAFSLLGLFLIGVGTGGIKPCVSSFGGDQFVLPQQERQLNRFFSVFYFSINAGSLLSTFLTPILRERVACFGAKNCYPLAFGVPAILMCLSLVIFISGRPLYKLKKPEGNIILSIAKCIRYAVFRKVQVQKFEKKDHWLDYADDRFSSKLINDTKALMRIMLIFTPTIFFWALYDQQGSRWTFQARHMDGNIGGWVFQPDQMQTLNSILCLAFIPLFDSVLYPFLAKLHLLRTPLQKMCCGGLLAAVAFVMSGVLQLKIEAGAALVPSPGTSSLRLYNSIDCPVQILSNDLRLNSQFNGLDTELFRDFPFNQKGSADLKLVVHESCQRHSNQSLTEQIHFNDGEISSYLLTIDGTGALKLKELNLNGTKDVQKPETTDAKLSIFYGGDEPILVKIGNDWQKVENHKSPPMNLKSNTQFVIKINENSPAEPLFLKPGGVYTMMLYGNSTFPQYKTFVISQPNTISLLWQVPQYIVITAAEIMFSVTGLQFSFTQAPVTMKSVISAFWLLTDSFGNIILIILAKIHFFDSQADEYFLFAGIMTAVMGIFIIVAINYTYADNASSESDAENKNELETSKM